MRQNTKKQPFIQCRACGTIKFSKNVNDFKHKTYNSNFEFSSK